MSDRSGGATPRTVRVPARGRALVTHLLVALTLLLPLAVTGGGGAAEAAGTGEYGAPVWYPLRGTSQVGCTWDNGCNGHHSYYALDLLQPKGSPVYPAGAGRLTIKGTNTVCASSGYGTWVEIDHGDGVTTRYAHLSKITVADGSWVDQTTKIGEVGSTGSVSSCTAYHLHFEERLNGVKVAPRALKGCDGTVYPTTWGYSGWDDVPSFAKRITNTGDCGDPSTPPEPPQPEWESISGSLVQMDFGPQGEIWGVDADARLLRYEGWGRWSVQGEGFRWVTVGKAPNEGGPNVYALTTSGRIQRSLNGIRWQRIPGILVQIDHGPQGDIWGVNSAGNLYQYAGRYKWTKRGTGYRAVTVGEASEPGGPDVYALTASGAIRSTLDGVNWQSISGTLVQIDHGPQGELWGVNAAGNIYRRIPGRWSKEDTGFRHVTAGRAADAGGPYVYALKTDGTIRRRR